MKPNKALYAVVAVAALSVASQAFARGGSAGGSMGHGGGGGTPRISSTMMEDGATGMQQGSMPGNETHQQPASGSAPRNMAQAGQGKSANHRQGQVQGSGTGRTPQQQHATTVTTK